MVQVLPRFDPWGDAGKQAGQTINQGLVRGIRQGSESRRLKSGLETLQALGKKNEEGVSAFEQMSVPERIAAVMMPFADMEGGQGAMQTILKGGIGKVLESVSSPSSGDLPKVNQYEPGSDDYALKQLIERTNVKDQTTTKPGVQKESITENIEIEPQAQAQDVRPQKRASNDQQVVLPSSSGMRNRYGPDTRYIQSSPNLKAKALRGDPEGMSPGETLEYIRDQKLAGLGNAEIQQNVNNFNQNLKSQFSRYQDIQDGVIEQTQAMYTDSPNYDLFERIGMNEANKQIDSGRFDKASVENVVRTAQKRLEAVFQGAEKNLGRGIFGQEEKKRLDLSTNWLQPLISRGEKAVAMQLLMADQIETEDGKILNGPDYGPVQASRSVYQGSKEGRAYLSDLKKFDSDIPDINYDMEWNKKADFTMPGLKPYREKANQQLNNVANYIKNMPANGSLTLLRGALYKKGYDEEFFNNALELADEMKGDDNFSDYQEWEISNIISKNVRPSFTEVFAGTENWSAPFKAIFGGKR